MDEETDDQPAPINSELYNPSVEEENDETHEMFNLSADEEAAEEMATFLAELEKDDISEAIRQGLKKKFEVATTKLSGLFKKQQELIAEEEQEVRAELEKELHQLSQQQHAGDISIEDEKKAKKQDHMKQIMLQKRVAALTNQVELADQKSRSVSMQW